MQGVGKETDVLVLTSEGVSKVSDEKINILRSIYKKELVFGKDNEELKKISWD